ncbi:TetR/AcrR family transcriptional regulator [Nocardia donostiensis]|uniref:TetR family transcriptional regulator n=1 Tax=Nocardia donostiensis TaxID=1538463 RepID=A0A1W0B3C9_9NOCA|nr:TetR/AcrR family transcriptional regulator [Nocardia donostiensis]ONM46422.1 TetR family transcriptional regulator [Nocardia donostiensis]OQS16288.1 TetR family transcriptional regulator [Nocardia donostiensis]OQS17033.1 TetR family transcriptional regulator [Nocardia donostiensis]
MSTPRARARAQTITDIKRIAREHLATDGAAALSLRAVARDLGVVSSAVYRYVRSRDELLTMLVVDGYDNLADAVDTALATAPDDPLHRLRTTAHAIRDWALTEPAWYGLLFGTPVPGYTAPAEHTVAPGTRVIATLLRLFEQAHQRNLLTTPTASAEPTGPLVADFARVRAEFGVDIPDWLLARGLTVWCTLFGAVNFDVFDMYGADTFTDRTEVFDLHLDAVLALLGADQ